MVRYMFRATSEEYQSALAFHLERRQVVTFDQEVQRLSIHSLRMYVKRHIVLTVDHGSQAMVNHLQVEASQQIVLQARL